MRIIGVTAVMFICAFILGMTISSREVVYQCSAWQKQAVIKRVDQCFDDDAGECMDKAIRDICRLKK